MSKILYYTPTQTLCPYPRNDDEPVVGLDPDYEVFDIVQDAEPTYDPATQYLTTTETIDTVAETVTYGWQINDLPPPPPPPDHKIWANAQAFVAEFTDEEKAGIALSTDPTVAALRFELSTWFSEVHSNEPRVVAGLDKLVELQIITENRRTEIIAH
jgi:hypothetical protein